MGLNKCVFIPLWEVNQSFHFLHLAAMTFYSLVFTVVCAHIKGLSGSWLWQCFFTGSLCSSLLKWWHFSMHRHLLPHCWQCWRSAYVMQDCVEILFSDWNWDSHIRVESTLPDEMYECSANLCWWPHALSCFWFLWSLPTMASNFALIKKGGAVWMSLEDVTDSWDLSWVAVLQWGQGTFPYLSPNVRMWLTT